MKQAITYARYSSDRQSDTFIEAQLEKTHKNCKEKGYVVVKEYFNVVVVYKLDRFARNLYDSVVYTKKLKKLNLSEEGI